MNSERIDFDDLRRLLDASAPDAKLCDAYERLLVSLNCEAAAEGYLAAVGFICARRPHLADRLLRRPIDALLQLGAENIGSVVRFVDSRVREPSEHFTQWAGADGIQWLRTEFPKFAESMAPLFEDCLRDLEARLRDIDFAGVGQPRTVEQLGEIRRVFRPDLGNRIAGIILGLLMIGAGCFMVGFPIYGVIESGGNLPFWRDTGEKGWAWGAVGLAVPVGIAVIITGGWLIWWMWSLFSFQVLIGEYGCAVLDKSTVRVFGWDDVVSVQETHVYERQLRKSFSVTLKQGEPFEFDGTTIKGHAKLAKMIKEETDPRNITWNIVAEHGS